MMFEHDTVKDVSCFPCSASFLFVVGHRVCSQVGILWRGHLRRTFWRLKEERREKWRSYILECAFFPPRKVDAYLNANICVVASRRL